jgi:hypothetical protein
MGNTLSIDDEIKLEARKVRNAIDRKCDCYVASIEHTNSIVDVKLLAVRLNFYNVIFLLVVGDDWRRGCSPPLWSREVQGNSTLGCMSHLLAEGVFFPFSVVYFL